MDTHRLLFVDDEEHILSALRRLFRKEPWEILTATSGEEGLRVLEANQVSLVVSDQRMPGMTGVEFLSQVRRRWPDTLRIILTGYADMQAALAAINQGQVYRFVSKPWSDEELRLAVKQGLEQYELVAENRRLHQLTRAQNAELRKLNETLEQKVAERTEEIVRKNVELDRLNVQLEQSFVDSIKVFSGLIEQRDPFLGGHSKRVAAGSKLIGKRIGLSPKELMDLEIAALLHDIGKIGIRDDILRKDVREMSSAELEMFKRHPVLGQVAIQTIPRLQAAGVMIRHHHERYDGQGYPDGLQGEDIPFGARMIAAVNAYDIYVHRTSGAQLGTADRFNRAIARLRDNRGTEFDPQVVDHFLDYLALERARAGTRREKKISVYELREGMVLARDLYTPSGLLLVAKGEVVEASYIEKIKNYNRVNPIQDGVYIYAEVGS